MYQPKVSIIIPAYNASNYIDEAIKSALAQTYPNIEIIVVNDGSKDERATESICQKYRGAIKYFYKENGGSSTALNYGIQKMSGEWFSWLSHDDLYYPTKIEKEIQFLNSLSLPVDDIEKCVCFSASEIIDANGRVLRDESLKNIEKTERYINKLKGNEYLIAEPTRFTFHGCSCLIHKSVFDKVGLFDEKLRLLNDVDMWFRIYAANFRICYVPDVLVKGRVHKAQISRNIGFSYHNPEQDMYWNRSLQWLVSNFPNKYQLFFLFGRNAFLKTRNTEGRVAFDIASRLAPNKRLLLRIRQFEYQFISGMKEIAKKLYITVALRK